MLESSVLVFDIETVIDIDLAKYFYQLDLSDQDVLSAVKKILRQNSHTEFPAPAFHKIVCISGLWINEISDQFQLFSWALDNYSEKEILQRFVQIFDKQQPILVSWNGSQFDLPVILQRCLQYGLTASNLFEQGERDRQKRFNNYQNRYHTQHTDLMDVLACFYSKHFQKLNDIAKILALPGKLGIYGEDVSMLVQQDKWDILKTYCEHDVLNIWLIYLRWLLLRGFVSLEQHNLWIQQTMDYLQRFEAHQQFLSVWQESLKNSPFMTNDLIKND